MIDPVSLTFTLLRRFPLRHTGDTGLLGAGDDALWVEEIYGDGWMAQHQLALDGTISASVDEDEGRITDLSPLIIPPEATIPRRGWNTMGLNFTGARRRGLREEDRLLDVLRPLSIAGKAALSARLDIPIPNLLGIAESYVLAECALSGPTDWLVCRRLRIAHTVPRQLDVGGLPFDYDTRELLLLHRFDTRSEPAPLEILLAGPGADITLYRPMDCLRTGDQLIVADGGGHDRPSAVCVIAIEGLPAPVSRTDALFRKLYG